MHQDWQAGGGGGGEGGDDGEGGEVVEGGVDGPSLSPSNWEKVGW